MTTYETRFIGCYRKTFRRSLHRYLYAVTNMSINVGSIQVDNSRKTMILVALFTVL
jgi:hypothetical protein